MPMASFATKLLRVGKDDDIAGVTSSMDEQFHSTIEALTRFNRDRAPGYDYRYVHTE